MQSIENYLWHEQDEKEYVGHGCEEIHLPEPRN